MPDQVMGNGRSSEQCFEFETIMDSSNQYSRCKWNNVASYLVAAVSECTAGCCKFQNEKAMMLIDPASIMMHKIEELPQPAPSKVLDSTPAASIVRV